MYMQILVDFDCAHTQTEHYFLNLQNDFFDMVHNAQLTLVHDII